MSRYRAALEFTLDADTAEEAADILDALVTAAEAPLEARLLFEGASYPVPVERPQWMSEAKS